MNKSSELREQFECATWLKKRMRARQSPEPVVSLQDRRAFQKSRIMSIVNENADMLTSFGEIIEGLLSNVDLYVFEPIKVRGDFTDGFLLPLAHL